MRKRPTAWLLGDTIDHGRQQWRSQNSAHERVADVTEREVKLANPRRLPDGFGQWAGRAFEAREPAFLVARVNAQAASLRVEVAQTRAGCLFLLQWHPHGQPRSIDISSLAA